MISLIFLGFLVTGLSFFFFFLITAPLLLKMSVGFDDLKYIEKSNNQ